MRVPSATTLRTLASGHWGDIVLVGLLVVVSAGVTLAWIHPQVNSFTLQAYGDQAWIQASAQVAMQTGPFATNPHAGAFSGFDPWAYPTGGAIGFYSAAWLLGLVESSSSNVVALIMAATSAAVTACAYAAIRLAAARPVGRTVAALGAITIGLSPYVVSKMGHYNVAAVYLLPAVIAALGFLRVPRARRVTLTVLGIVAVIGLISPLWWTFVSIYFLALGLAVSLFTRSRHWTRTVAAVLSAVVVGGAIPMALSVTHAVGGGSWNRVPWDSTIYSGSLSDFILGSPLVTSLFPHLEMVLPATSRELSAVGLIPTLTAIAPGGGETGSQLPSLSRISSPASSAPNRSVIVLMSSCASARMPFAGPSTGG